MPLKNLYSKFEKNFDHTYNSFFFFGLALFSVTVGLTLGGTIDSSMRKLQNDTDEWRQRQYFKALIFFFLQISINIILIIIFTKISDNFIPWLQLSVSGAFFATLLFVVQHNLVSNALKLTNF